RMALGGDKENPNIVEVLDPACDECPISGMYITPACRGCIVHKCQESCPKGAITIVNNHPIIDMTKCIKCGRCAKACPYNAIIEQKRPCVKSCPVKAISIDTDDKAKIDNSKCIACGACVYQCPFGAITDKSFIIDALQILKDSQNGAKYPVYAIVAPAIASQFKDNRLGQVVTAINKLGFTKVVEAALGADITLHKEVIEFEEKGLMTTSCCPSFVMFIEKNFPELAQYISTSPSPMVETANLIKRKNKKAKTIFIGPCTSKKLEFKLPKTKGAIDCVISFEELQAFIDARGIDLDSLEETPLLDASNYGRAFAKCGGIVDDVKKMAQQMNIDNIKPISMNGIAECNVNLLKLKLGKAGENFFEGMACDGGCLNGALCLHHDIRNINEIDKFSNEAQYKDINHAVEMYEESLDEQQ
ncbi:MAG: monomeric [FeFe] hydrogenase, partial [Clostridia bacterium]